MNAKEAIDIVESKRDDVLEYVYQTIEFCANAGNCSVLFNERIFSKSVVEKLTSDGFFVWEKSYSSSGWGTFISWQNEQ